MKSKKRLSRRGFLKGAATGAAAGLVVPTLEANAQEPTPVVQRGTAPGPSAAQLALETDPVPTEVDVLTADSPGSDFMVDVLKSLDFEYIASNPGASFRSLQESFINYGANKSPEWLTCCHEESSVGMAAGYFRVDGKPMLVAAHGTVGLQHASMMIYDAFCARIPVYVILGNHLDATERRPGVEWYHSVQDAASMVRDYIKWDDTPISLTHFAESAVRAYKIAMTVPMAPVVLIADGHLQENPAEDRSKLRIPKLTMTLPPVGDPAQIVEVAKLLVAADSPVIIAGRAARTAQGMQLITELAETLQAPVQGGPRNIASGHSLSGGGSVATADVILGLEVDDFWGTIHLYSRPTSEDDQISR